MSFPPYPSYREIPVEWIGPIPSDWEVRPLLAVADECDRSNRGMVEDNLLSLSYGSIVRRDINTSDGLLPESFETYQVVEPDDVVWRLTDLQNDKRSLRTALVGERGIITSAYLATRPHSIMPAYFAHLLRAYDQEKVFYSMGGGLRQSMKFADVRRMPILVPSVLEQAAIAAFLDRETAKIDALVEEQRRLIELLKEKRQAVISHAVSKGLDPTVPMKDSGVEWLGDVPAHWKIAKLRRLSRQIVDGAHFTPTYVEEGVPFLRVTDVTRRQIDLNEVKRIPREEHQELIRRCRPERGDLLLSKNGTIGVPAVVTWDWEFSIFVSLCLIKLNEELEANYARYVFLSKAIELQINDGAKQSTVNNLHLEKIASFIFPVPDANEQRAIVAKLDIETDRLDALLWQAEAAVSLLLERRAAVVSAAVTGKIDVRSSAVQSAKAA